MAADLDGGGYWLVATRRRDLRLRRRPVPRRTGGSHLNQPIVGMAADRTATATGWWPGDGGIFAFGDATFYGSTGGSHLNRPIVGLAST